MAFDDKKLNAVYSLTTGVVPINWTYKQTTDTLATIKAVGYFNAAANKLSIDDNFYIVGSDGRDFQAVSAITPNVEIESFIDVGDIKDNSITTSKLKNAPVDGVDFPSGGESPSIVLPFFSSNMGLPNPHVYTAERDMIILFATVSQGANGVGGDSLTIKNGGSGNPIFNVFDLSGLANAFQSNTTRDAAEYGILKGSTIEFLFSPAVLGSIGIELWASPVIF